MRVCTRVLVSHDILVDSLWGLAAYQFTQSGLRLSKCFVTSDIDNNNSEQSRRVTSTCDTAMGKPELKAPPVASPVVHQTADARLDTKPFAFTLDDLVIGGAVGQGSFGTVYKARLRFSTTLFALKIIPIANKPQKDVNVFILQSALCTRSPLTIFLCSHLPQVLMREIDILTRLDHPNIIHMHATFRTAEQVSRLFNT
jgi:hypothetical protein